MSGQVAAPAVAQAKAAPTLLIDFKALNRWPALCLEREVEVAQQILQARPENMLRVVTWNVWFDPLYAHQRQRALFQEVLKVAPDVVCLQEVLPGFAEVVRKCPDLLALYDVSPCDVQPYGVMLLVRRELGAVFSDMWLSSNMARRLVSAELKGRWPGMFITTAHLESLNARGLRKQQLAEAARWMRGRSHCFLCGDFNFDDTKTWGDWKEDRNVHAVEDLENHILQEELPDYVDCWRECRPKDAGYTFDGLTNPVNCPDPGERMRYDRVMASRGGYAPKSADILGAEALDEAKDWGLRPSDHFGVLIDLEVLEACSETAPAQSKP